MIAMSYSLNRMKMRQIKKNGGVALPIILILLLVMTILGVTSLSSSTLQERMTASQRLREIAFNAAETTLRIGEAHAEEIADDIRRGFLTRQSDGAQFRFFGSDAGNPNPINGIWEPGFPAASQVNLGDTCNGGYCTPADFDTTVLIDPAAPVPVERWLDPEVWNDPARHRVIENFGDGGSNLGQLLQLQGIADAPQYIIEYLGQLPIRTDSDAPPSPSNNMTNCPSPGQPNDGYPYCLLDDHFFRITARAVAGLGGRESAVVLQSTIIIQN